MKRSWAEPLLKVLLPLVLLAAVAALGAGAVAWLNVRGEADLNEAATPASAELAMRGAYLALAGNCAGCHTARGGAAYAGGLPLETPFGTVYSSNLTPSATGLAAWTAADFRRALRHGRSRDGRILAPAFPYENYSRLSNTDADALFAWLRTLPAVAQANRPHELRFPYDTQAALAVWRALYFRPALFTPDAAQPAAWNRGAYLVQGLGHCSACHASRNALGANAGPLALGGGLMPLQNWYAPALNDARQAGVAHWPQADVVALLKTGRAPQASVAGPMAEVVLGSTQHLNDADLRAIATYLQALPAAPPTEAAADTRRDGEIADEQARAAQGRQVYADHCAACHGEQGQGVPGAYPALAGNRAVTLDPPANLVRVVLEGGYAPATAGNPRPYGMPPFAQTLDAAQVAAVLTYVRSAWGAKARAVSVQEVARFIQGGG